ncbi:response regulator transcription factor [Cellulophaga sp. E16_2]|uniref:LytR/AlgR family response regulator transcription factor n=1 Tax=unclassified Cellulophaga TaxID=2634405 RepID=UPI0013FE13ED|nr:MULTISPECIES: LytTR family DNA-binding domain-containing protein [unclassified Cellulophaga]MBO0593638.1 response regulator transcription factor [Cellulophaga sp. E16_2]
MSKITAIVIDDEIANIKGLQQKISKLFPDIEVVNTFQKPEDAIVELQKNQPDLVFLDIEMPRINGFDLLTKLTKINFQIIFVTAYNEYAIEAFKQNAVDYVLKPIANDDLITAVNKAKDIINQKAQNESNTKLLSLLTEHVTNNNKLLIPTVKGISFIPYNEVLHIEGYEGYTKIHLLNNTTITSSYNIGKFANILDNPFFKCHKSHIVHLDKVRSFENEGYVVLENGNRVPISKTYKKTFIDLQTR